MAKILAERLTADLSEHGDEIAVFLIGMRVNHYWKVHKWLPVALAMTRMLKELQADGASGLLSFEGWAGRTSILVQYWESFDHLERYAVDKAREHAPAWAAFNKAVGSNGDVGIWHETYRVRTGDYECVYNNMPPFGLAKATQAVPAIGRREFAPGRMAIPKREVASG